jgi:hypothetical protein
MNKNSEVTPAIAVRDLKNPNHHQQRISSHSTNSTFLASITIKT